VPLDNFRPHSIRHGAVKNGKALKVNPLGHAAHLCMTPNVYETKYGLEDATAVGQEVTSQIVNSSQRESRLPG
jgi:hypothetical protein